MEAPAEPPPGVGLGGETTGDAHRCVVILALERLEEIAGPGLAAPPGGPTHVLARRAQRGPGRVAAPDRRHRARPSRRGSRRRWPWRARRPTPPAAGRARSRPTRSLRGCSVVGQEADRVAGDLADIAVLDTASQTRPEPFAFLGGGRLVDGDVDRRRPRSSPRGTGRLLRPSHTRRCRPGISSCATGR